MDRRRRRAEEQEVVVLGPEPFEVFRTGEDTGPDRDEFAAVDLALQRTAFGARMTAGADERDGEDSFVHAVTMARWTAPHGGTGLICGW